MLRCCGEVVVGFGAAGSLMVSKSVEICRSLCI
ncbi:hypothetical protein A2U01_0109568, partial [Trifolium medium]|nr:hypothetical protein [Trifolium medium]